MLKHSSAVLNRNPPGSQVKMNFKSSPTTNVSGFFSSLGFADAGWLTFSAGWSFVSALSALTSASSFSSRALVSSGDGDDCAVALVAIQNDEKLDTTIV